MKGHTMLNFTPLMTRTAIAKSLGFLVGLIGFWGTRTMLPTADPLLAWGVLALFVTIGGVVGISGTVNHIPIFKLAYPPWLRGGLMGGWFTFLTILFGYDMLAQALISISYLPEFFKNPWWMIADGIVVGALIDIIVSRLVKNVPDLYVA
tara:strand:+ start:404 stop:853 length:450 start_codon:yes stop_codon:yes gene_type:complete